MSDEWVDPVPFGAIRTVWCNGCGGPSDVVDESDEQVGFEERAREVRVTRLGCGHEIVRPS